MTIGLAGQAYVLANIAIGLGYLAVPALVLPFLNLHRRTIVFGAMFFIGCTGSHANMVHDVIRGHDQHPAVGWFAVTWHVVQAIGTWGFIGWFRRDLATAKALLDQVEKMSGGDSGARA